jgi:hypothetical protein
MKEKTLRALEKAGVELSTETDDNEIRAKSMLCFAIGYACGVLKLKVDQHILRKM